MVRVEIAQAFMSDKLGLHPNFAISCLCDIE